MAPQRVYLENVCPDCHSVFSSPTSLLNHLRSAHSTQVSGRSPGRNRPANPDYLYVKRDAAEIHHSACPCCWAHFPVDNVKELEDHFYDHLASDLESGALQETEEEFNEHENPDNDNALYEEKRSQLFDTLDDLITNFKKLLPYSGATKKQIKH